MTKEWSGRKCRNRRNEELRVLRKPQLSAEEYEQETTVLLGKRLSILGFDSCVMGMLEVAYQFSPFTDTMIASEGHRAGSRLDVWQNPRLSGAE